MSCRPTHVRPGSTLTYPRTCPGSTHTYLSLPARQHSLAPSTAHAPSAVLHVSNLASPRLLRVPHHHVLQPRHLDLDSSPRPCHLVFLRSVFVDRVGSLPHVHPRPRLLLCRVPPFFTRRRLVVVHSVLQRKHQSLVRRRTDVVVKQRLELKMVGWIDARCRCIRHMQIRAQLVLPQRHHIRKLERSIIYGLDAWRRAQRYCATLSATRAMSTWMAHSDGQIHPTHRPRRHSHTSTPGFSQNHVG